MEGLSVDDDVLLDLGRKVIETEGAAVMSLAARIDHQFAKACRLMLGCRGRIIVCGIGKSGHIGNKMAATFASTGSPAFFVHAAEASHGDLGMVQAGDVVLAISYSGTSNELLTLIPGIKRLGVPLVSMSGEPDSPLAQAADVNLDTSVQREACPLGLAPTASTTATLALGDALAIALLGARGFDENDFARSHPGGRLGRRLLLRISDVMVRGDALPVVNDTVLLPAALMEITRKGLGMVAVVSGENQLRGLYTDGDLRRTIEQDNDLRKIRIDTVMTHNPRSIEANMLAFDAVTIMQDNRITALPVLEDQQLVGIVTMHALLQAGVV
jgi:arabinose-5-phosphate isomerase